MKRVIDYRLDIYLVTFAVLLYLFRISLPPLKYPSLFLCVTVQLYVLIRYRSALVESAKIFFRNYLLPLCLLAILVLAIVLSNKLYQNVITDTLNVVVILSFFYTLTVLIKSSDDFRIFQNCLVNLIIVFSFVIALFGLIVILDILPDYDTLFNEHGNRNLIDTSIIDYNFSLLPVFFGFIAVFLKLQKQRSTLSRIIYIAVLTFFTLQIFLTGSRRGLIILLVLIAVIAVLLLYSMFSKSSWFNVLKLNSLYYFISISALSVLLYICAFHTSYKFKKDFLEFVGSKNVYVARSKITSNLFRYAPAFDRAVSYSDFYKALWTIKFDPLDPDLGDWGTRIHNTVFPLKGKNVEIVPADAKGYMMDSTCNCLTTGKNFCESYTLVTELDCKDGEEYNASVYCFVSGNFNGKAVSLGTDYYSVSSGIVKGDVVSYYDLGNKDSWQKLSISFSTKEGKVPIFMSFLQDSVIDFSKLKGYVVFAYPQFSNGKKTGLSISETIVPVTPVSYSSFVLPLSLIKDLLSKKSPGVSDLKSKIYAHLKDTTYYPPSKTIITPVLNKGISVSRKDRWQFAFNIYRDEYDIKQKVFGKGFDFMNWYGYRFLSDKTKEDWPHNPFLAVLLYSGIIGLFFYLFLLFNVFKLFVLNLNHFGISFIFFLITFFFSFFSGSSPFDPPIMGFFILYPFLIKRCLAKVKKI